MIEHRIESLFLTIQMALIWEILADFLVIFETYQSNNLDFDDTIKEDKVLKRIKKIVIVHHVVL